eukprot:9503138-Pyramimonas_sp.AAC.1
MERTASRNGSALRPPSGLVMTSSAVLFLFCRRVPIDADRPPDGQCRWRTTDWLLASALQSASAGPGASRTPSKRRRSRSHSGASGPAVRHERT